MTNKTERDPTYCSLCYGAAQKHGRTVKMTDQYAYPICLLCESRIRNGLVHYIPSNGTEAMMFEERCERCRHSTERPEHGCLTCAYGIIDKMLDSAWAESDSAKAWYDPAEMQTQLPGGSPSCPATCLRFTDRNDPAGELRDPPPKDCIGQMFLGELLTVPEPVRELPWALANANPEARR